MQSSSNMLERLSRAWNVQDSLWLYRATFTEPQAAVAIGDIDEASYGADEPRFNFFSCTN